MTQQMRKIVRIDEDLCDGCGACVPDCAEGAIQIVNGKAKLMADNLCDGIGNCLGSCPKGAITIDERPAVEFDQTAVQDHQASLSVRKEELKMIAEKNEPTKPMACGCPGEMMRTLQPVADSSTPHNAAIGAPSRLGHWPVQLSLLPVEGNMWQDADVLLAADCVAFALPDFHERLLKGKVLAIACPKLDDGDSYVAKLAAIFARRTVKSIMIARMEVPCCGGLERIVDAALAEAGVSIPVSILVISAAGRIMSVNGLNVA